MNNVEKNIKEYKEKINSLSSLPTLPVIATEILRMTGDDKISINQMIPLIEKDPPLAMKVLKIANSAYYGVRREVNSLRQAIVIIGLDQLRNVAISFSVIDNMKVSAGSNEINWKKFWEHSIYTGFVNELLAEELQLFNIQNAYIHGLLHDIGKLVFSILEKEDYISLLIKAQKTERPIHKLELGKFKINHGDIGYLVGENWEITDKTREVMKYHHSDFEAIDSNFLTEIQLCTLSNIITTIKGMNFVSYYSMDDEVAQNCWNYLKKESNYKDISLNELITENLKDRLESITEMVELIQT